MIFFGEKFPTGCILAEDFKLTTELSEKCNIPATKQSKKQLKWSNTAYANLSR